MEPVLVSVDQAAHIVGLGKSKLYELLLSGQLKSVKIGRRRLIPAQALKDFVDGLTDSHEVQADSATESFTWPEQPDDR